MHVLLLGAPGVGKGTQSVIIRNEFEIPQISTGDILRAEIRNESDLGKEVKSIMERGELVSDDLILKIVAKRISLPDCNNGFILDGFPRTTPQAEGLEGIMDEWRRNELKVLEIYVPDEEIIRRLTSRRVCSQCQYVYNIADLDADLKTPCKECGGKIIQRDDDSEATIRRRLAVYRKSTEPLIEFYKQRSHFYRIDGMNSVEVVAQKINHLLRESRPRAI